MARFPEAETRLIKNKYVCRKCKAAIRADPMSVIAGVIMCRRCRSRALRPKRKR